MTYPTVALTISMTGHASKPDGQPPRALDTTRARKRIGFVARTPWEEGLRRTIEWYETAVVE